MPGAMLAARETEADEAALVLRAKHDPLQFGQLYDQHYRRIYGYAYSKVGQKAVAEDVASEVFMKAFAAMPRYRETGRPFAAWLYRIAANTINDRRRRQRPCEPIHEVRNLSVGSSAEELAIGRDEMRRISRLVQALPPNQRTVVVLRYQHDLPLDEIALAMGKSSGAVKVILHRALCHLRAQAKALRTAA